MFERLAIMAESVIAPLVRQAEVADAAAIASSHILSWQAGYADVISNEFLQGLSTGLSQRTLRWQAQILGAEAEGRFVLVGEVDGEVAGWLNGGPCRDAGPDEPSLGEVYGCYVDPAHWRQGVGSALMAAALERLAQAGYRQAVLWVLADNPRARAFYEHHGWLADGANKTFEVAGECHREVRYRRSLP
jgi:ribosomal protein S18 acetylase RimI-like enzyme